MPGLSPLRSIGGYTNPCFPDRFEQKKLKGGGKINQATFPDCLFRSINYFGPYLVWGYTMLENKKSVGYGQPCQNSGT